jgi:DNA polymerase-3 subunit gamma/tau
MESLYNKYRPATWADVIGQDVLVRSFRASLKQKLNHAYLLSGPSGVGKTTLARIAAAEMGCRFPHDVTEIDAAKYTGIEDMREVTDDFRYQPLDGAVKAVIIDEVHALSKQAFTSLLKSLEEPPPWIYIFLCTTDQARVPANVQSRCTRYGVSPVDTGLIFELLEKVAKLEKWGRGNDEWESILDVCAKAALGSPRVGLVNLGICHAAKNREEARSLLKSGVVEVPAAIDLAKALVNRQPWAMLVELIGGLKGENPESIRHTVQAYVTAVLLNPKSKNQASLLAVLDAFSVPFHSSNGIAPVLLAVGKLVHG